MTGPRKAFVVTGEVWYEVEILFDPDEWGTITLCSKRDAEDVLVALGFVRAGYWTDSWHRR